MTSRESSSTLPNPSSRGVPNESSSTWYLHHLDSHILTSKDHVVGRSSAVPYPSATRPTVVPPSNALWTPDEKSLFFASLRRHSRFRPDLIADQVGSKTQIEVEWYLDLLESGSDLVGQVDKNRVDTRRTRARWDGGRSWRKGLAPACREVSEKWIEEEEVMAEGVMRVVNNKDNDDHAENTRRARRAEKTAVNKTLPDNPEWSWWEKKKQRENDPSLKAMEDKWAIEDWAADLDWEKLSALNSLMMPDWSEWYGDRVHPRTQSRSRANSSSHAQSDSASDSEDENEDVGPGKGGGGSQGKITADNRTFTRLDAIPRGERTPAQRKELAAIINRRRNRERYRTAKLLAEGMTVQEIEQAGGADAVFASRENPTGVYPQKKVAKTNGVDEESDMVKKLKKWRMYEYVMLDGLEVFNYELVDRLMTQIAPSAPPNLSFTVLRNLRSQLVNYLKSLIYTSITIAEQFAAQQTGNDIPDMTAEHVRQALALSGAGHPLGLIEEAIHRIFSGIDAGPDIDDNGEEPHSDIDGQHDDSAPEADQENFGPAADGPAPGEDGPEGAGNENHNPTGNNLRRAQYHRHLLAQGDVPWHLIPSVSAVEEVEVNPAESAVTDGNEVRPNLQSTAVYIDHHEGLTDEEDLDLDNALIRMDRSHDRSYESALWTAYGGDTLNEDEMEAELDDGAEVWSSRYVRSASGRRYRMRARHEQAYINLLFSVDAARRKRRYVERQAERYPTTRLRRQAAQNRGIKSAAFIVESDESDEGEEDDDVEMSDLGSKDDEDDTTGSEEETEHEKDDEEGSAE